MLGWAFLQGAWGETVYLLESTDKMTDVRKATLITDLLDFQIGPHGQKAHGLIETIVLQILMD